MHGLTYVDEILSSENQIGEQLRKVAPLQREFCCASHLLPVDCLASLVGEPVELVEVPERLMADPQVEEYEDERGTLDDRVRLPDCQNVF